MPKRKVVLLVDDEEVFLRTVVDGFAGRGDPIVVRTAPNGKVALGILGRERVDLVVTDLKMPEMDGFALIAHMSRVHPQIPVIVMTAFGTPEIDVALQKSGVVQCLDKPFDLSLLAEKIQEALQASTSGHLNGIALSTVLQMVELDRKTCTVQVRSGEALGQLFFKRGMLADASAGPLDGAAAAMDIVCWPEPEIDFLSGPTTSTKDLSLSVTQILLDAFRLSDERDRARARVARQDAPQPAPARKTAPKPAPSSPQLATSRSTPPPPPTASLGSHSIVATTSVVEHRIKETDMSSVQEKIKELSNVDGVVGVAVYTPQGELLAHESTGSFANLKDAGVLANNVLMNAQKASLEMGTGRGQVVHVEAEQSNIVVRCHNEGTDPLRSEPGKAHIHMVVVMKPEAPIGLVKLRAGTVIQKLAEDFRA